MVPNQASESHKRFIWRRLRDKKRYFPLFGRTYLVPRGHSAGRKENPRVTTFSSALNRRDLGNPLSPLASLIRLRIAVNARSAHTVSSGCATGEAMFRPSDPKGEHETCTGFSVADNFASHPVTFSAITRDLSRFSNS